MLTREDVARKIMRLPPHLQEEAANLALEVFGPAPHDDGSLYRNDMLRRLARVAARLLEHSAPALSPAEQLALEPIEKQQEFLNSLEVPELRRLQYQFRGFWARPEQLAPDGDWAVWLVRAGRGFGKTRAETNFLHERATEQPGRWMAIVAKTPADARDYNIEGPGGLLKNIPIDERPLYESSKRRVTWPNGSWATIYSDEEPDQLRGFSGDTACLDEFAKYKHPQEVWDNLMFGMREASVDRPRVMIPTTPRPIPILQQIEARKTTVTVTGSSYANRGNLAPEWYKETLQQYEGTRLGRQEIHAEYLGDTPGALWTRQLIETNRRERAPELVRIVVGVDPSATSKEESDEAGIIAGGLGLDGHVYLLADRSGRGTPHEWGTKAVGAYHDHIADCLVAEVNNGGEMVEFVVHTIDSDVSYKDVWASRGKQTRAEPVSALYEQGMVHHVGTFPELEDEQCTWVPGMPSPNRMDAAVWVVTELKQLHRKKDKKPRQVRAFIVGDEDDTEESHGQPEQPAGPTTVAAVPTRKRPADTN